MTPPRDTPLDANFVCVLIVALKKAGNRTLVLRPRASKGNEEIDQGIVYSPIDYPNRTYCNLGFGDLIYDERGFITGLDDRVADNNGDFRGVIGTVVSTLPDFFSIHPYAKVHIKGSTEQRSTVFTPEQRRKALEVFVEQIEEGIIGPFAEKTNEARQNLVQAGLLQK